MRIAVYPGSFDPITNGHLDIIRRAARIYDKLIVGVLDNINKKPVFTAQERCEMIRSVTADIENVDCDVFSGLLVDFAKQNNASVIVKGLRTVADFEYEFQMADTKYSYISSSMVKEVAKYRGSLDGLIPHGISEKVKEKYK